MREGLIPHVVSAVLSFETDEDNARSLTELLGEVLDPSETAVSSFEIEDAAAWSGAADADAPDRNAALNPPWRVEIYFASPPDRAAMRELIEPILGRSIPEEAFSEVAQKDWVNASLSGLAPVRAGRVLVHGAHDRDKVRVNDVALEIEAALAFGTGHHGTTSGCLLALVQELKRRRPRHVLDVGTGTGILAFAVAKQAKLRVVAGDIDAEAIRVARENARLNGIAPFMKLYVAPGVQHALADRPRHFDLVIANILATPLKQLSRALARVLSGDGTLILSGLLIRDVPGVVAAYGRQGVHLCARTHREGWATLVLKRRAAKPNR